MKLLKFLIVLVVSLRIGMHIGYSSYAIVFFSQIMKVVLSWSFLYIYNKYITSGNYCIFYL